MVKVLSSRLQQCLGPFTMLLVERSSETGRFTHLSNHVFERPQFWKYIGYEGHLFFWNSSKFNVDCRCAERNGENFCGFWDNSIGIACIKLSLLRREFLSSAVSLLTVLRFCIALKEAKSNSITSLGFIKCCKGAVAQIATVFGPVDNVACRRVLWNGTF